MSASSVASATAVRSTDACAPTCALFTCCVCRRAVALDGRNMKCVGTLPDSAAASTARLPTGGGFLITSRVPQHAGNETNGRHQQEENNGKKQETMHRQQLHPAIKGSIRSAAGRYGILSPSPLSPWRETRYAELRNSRHGGCNTPPGVRDQNRKTASQARIVARLSPYFLYQHSWMAMADMNAYVRELWLMLHGGLMPPPCPSSHLTVQRGDFRPRQLLLHDFPTPEFAASSSIGSHPLHVPVNPSRLSLPPMGNISHSASAALHSHTSRAVLEGDSNSSTDPAVLSTLQNSLQSLCFPRASTTPLVPERTQSVLCVEKIEAMIPQAVKLNNTANSTAVRRAAVVAPPPLASSRTSSMTEELLPPFVQPQHVAVSPSFPLNREVFLAMLSNRLMCHVVHKGNTDLPLCQRCWKDSLETLQKDTERIVEDVVSFSTAHAVTDVVNLVRCHNVCCLGWEESLEALYSENKSDEGLYRQQLLSLDEGGIVQLESLQRLREELLEAKAFSRLIAAACDAIREPLALLMKERQGNVGKLAAATAAYNAQQVFSFFTTNDAASGMAMRMKNTSHSLAFMSKTRAMLLAFPISTSAEVATIAGLRLGQLLSVTSRQRSSTVVQRSATSSVPSRLSLSESARETGTGMAPETIQLLTGSVVELNGSSEATALQHLQHLQHRYTRVVLGGLKDHVSVAEINNACGYLLLLLRHIVDQHRIGVESAILWPNGDQSRVEAIIVRGSPPKTLRRSADFFINERFFSWKTFGTACVIVTTYVQEIVSWMTSRLSQLKACVGERFNTEGETAAALLLSSLAPSSPPYVIAQDRVDGFLVRHGDVSEGLWTLGMKKLLTVVQWCMLASRDLENLQQLLDEPVEEE